MTNQKDSNFLNYFNIYFIESSIILTVCTILSLIASFLISNIFITILVTIGILVGGLFLLKRFSTYSKNQINIIPEKDDLKERLKNLLESAESLTKSGFGKKISVDSNDEIGKLADTFNYLLDNVGSFIKELDEISEESSDTSRKLADITQRTSCVMQEVSVTLQELTSNTSDLNGSIEEIADGAKKVENLSNEGISLLRELENKMDNIVKDADRATVSIRELNVTSKKMQGIIDVISNIAKQTNLLALNAAIEAARAGDTGKGFAVVADEVRQLAGNTQESLLSISELIGSFSEETLKTVQLINDNNKDIALGGQILKKTSDTFNIIADNITHMVEGIEKSALASSQIASGSQEIASATQVQTSAVSEIADLSQNLSNMSSELKATLADTQIGGAEVEFDLVAYDNSMSVITEKQRQELKESIGVNNKFVIGMIARLEPIKGYGFLIKGLKRVLNENNNAVCVIVGDGSLEHELKEQVKKEQLSNKIIFLGYRKDIQKLLSIMDLVVLTSEKEGMPPRILMEAMAAKKPIVATSVKGNKMLINNNETGFLVEYDNVIALSKSIEVFIKDPHMGIRFGNDGRNYLKNLIS